MSVGLRGGAARGKHTPPVGFITGATINGVTQAPAAFATLVAATPAAGTLVLPAGTYPGTSTVPVAMTINGAGMGQTIINCQGLTPAGSGQAVLVPNVTGCTFSNLTLENAAISPPDGNAAGVKAQFAGGTLTLTNVEITGCQDGILTPSSITLNGCNFHGDGNGNPGNGLTHVIYITTGAVSATITNQIADATNPGPGGLRACHALKSRAQTTTVSGGTFTGNPDDGTVGGSVIDIPDGGAVNISGATLVTQGSANNTFLGYGAESNPGDGRGTTVTLTNVHLTDNTGTGGIIANLGGHYPTATLAIGSGCVYDGALAPTLTGWGTVTGAFTSASLTTLTGLSPASGTCVPNATAGTLIATLSPTYTGVAPTGVTYSITSQSPAGACQIVSTNLLEVLNASLTAGSDTVSIQVSASNATNSPQTYTFALTVQVAGTLAVLGLNNFGGSTLTSPVVSVGHAFAKGDVPSGNKLVISGVTLQQDREAYWSDGSLRYAAISFQSPDTFTTTQTKNYTILATSGTPGRTPFITLAQLASGATINSVVFPATDFKMKFYQGDLGGTDTFHVGVNDIITNGTAFPWGSNPVQGWEVIRAGPVCCEWKFWGFLKRDSDSKFHRWVRATVWVRVWATGNYEVSAMVVQANCYGPGQNTNQTIGNATTPVRVSCFAELYNASTLIKAFGGPNDTRTYTFAASAVNTGTNTFSLTGPQSLTWGRTKYGSTNGGCYYGLGCIFSTSGGLPGGLSANTIYWPAQIYGTTVGTAFNVAGTRYDAMSANNGSAVPNQVTITSQGSGTHTITPVMSTFQSNGWYALDQNALPFWIGTGSKPTLLPVLDLTYLTRGAKALPYFDWTTTAYPINETPQTYMPGIPVYQSTFETGGDSAGDERINPAGGHSSLMTMYAQTDPGWYQNARALAAGFIDVMQMFVDEKSGQPVVCNLGPNRAGANYTNLGPTNSNYRGYYGGGSPPAVAISGSSVDWPGYDISFDAADFSHQPSPSMMSYLRSGDDWWLEQLKQQVGGLLAMGYQPNRNQNFGSNYYGGVVVDPIPQQVRTCAWSMRTLGFYDYIMPNSEAIRAFIKDCTDDNAAVLPPWGAAKSANEIAIGAFGVYGGGGAPPYQSEAGYMMGMIGVIYGWQALMGERSGWLTFYNNYLKNFWEAFNTANGGQCSDYWLGVYWWNMYVSTSGTGPFYASPAAFLAGNLGSATPGGTGFPTTQILNVQFQGVVGGTSGIANADWTGYVAMHRAALATLAAAGGTNAATILGHLNTRLSALGGIVYTDSTNHVSYPDWDILSS